MARISIQDLEENTELDREAIRDIVGGRATPGFGLFQARPRTLLDRRSTQGGSLLPQIGLGEGFLGHEKLP